jgi:hypothetical protein
METIIIYTLKTKHFAAIYGHVRGYKIL